MPFNSDQTEAIFAYSNNKLKLTMDILLISNLIRGQDNEGKIRVSLGTKETCLGYFYLNWVECMHFDCHT